MMYIALENYPGQELRELIGDEKKNAKKSFSKKTTRYYATEIAMGLCYLHHNGIAHLDMKTENIVLDVYRHARIIDYGIAKRFDWNHRGKAQEFSTSIVSGTHRWMSPEMIKDMLNPEGMIDLKYPTYKGDWWALGLIIYAMRTGGESPFCQYDPDNSKMSKIFVDQIRGEKFKERYLEKHLFRDLTFRVYPELCSNPFNTRSSSLF